MHRLAAQGVDRRRGKSKWDENTRTHLHVSSTSMQQLLVRGTLHSSSSSSSITITHYCCCTISYIIRTSTRCDIILVRSNITWRKKWKHKLEAAAAPVYNSSSMTATQQQYCCICTSSDIISFSYLVITAVLGTRTKYFTFMICICFFSVQVLLYSALECSSTYTGTAVEEGGTHYTRHG